MASPKKINLGVFPAGEIPYDFDHTFLDSDKTPIDLTGWTVNVEIEGPGVGPYGTGTMLISDPANGVTTYAWAAIDFTDFGKYEMLIWVTNGTYQLGSDLITYEVYDGPGPTP